MSDGVVEEAEVVYASAVEVGDFVYSYVIADGVWIEVKSVETRPHGQYTVHDWATYVGVPPHGFEHPERNYATDYVIRRRRDIEGAPA